MISSNNSNHAREIPPPNTEHMQLFPPWEPTQIVFSATNGGGLLLAPP